MEQKEETKKIVKTTPKSVRNINEDIWTKFAVRCARRRMKIYEGVNEALSEWADREDT